MNGTLPRALRWSKAPVDSSATLENTPLRCNNRNPLLSGLLSSAPLLKDQLLALVQPHLPVAQQAR